MSENKDILTDHAYDGIQEYDNPLPGWWTWLFILTIAFSVVYFMVSWMSGWQLSANFFYEKDVQEHMKVQYGELGKAQPDAQTILKLAGDERWNKAGAAIFAAQCALCHGSRGEGILAPNLTDDHYVNVTKIEDIVDVISRGRKDGAMPAFANRLQPAEILIVSGYVASLRGKNLPSARGVEGEKLAPW